MTMYARQGHTLPKQADHLAEGDYLVSRDGSLVRVAARGYTVGQRRTWVRLEPVSSPAYLVTFANDQLINVQEA
ncbi:MAG TPA: hypothetical protein VI699_05300 [Candidatus Acidoferrales bacterium]|nr:hypothetical protein [Candidatus Acidoferrales bacterium]